MKIEKILIVLIIFCSIMLVPKIVEASSLSVSVSSSKVNPGEKVTVYISTDCIGRFDISCKNGKVNENKLWLESSSDSFQVETGQSGITTVIITPANPVSTSAGEKVNLKPKTVEISINTTISGDGTVGGTSQNTGSSNNNVDTNNPGTTNNGGSTSNKSSSDATLVDLGITKYDFKGFKPENTSYNTSVPNDVTSVSVYAKVKASGAVYSVSGNKNLDVGTNKVTITVTAPDGKTKKNYYIYVARQAAEDEEVVPNVIDENKNTNEDDKKEEPLRLLSIAIEDGYEIYLEPEFKADLYEYIINYKGDLDYIPFKAIPNRENVKVDIQGNEKLKDGENTIVIKLIDEAKKEVVEYTIKVNKNIDNKVEDSETEKQENEETTANKKILNTTNLKMDEKKLIIAAGVLALIIFVVIILLVVKRKHKYLRLEEQNDEPIYKISKNKKSKGKHF